MFFILICGPIDQNRNQSTVYYCAVFDFIADISEVELPRDYISRRSLYNLWNYLTNKQSSLETPPTLTICFVIGYDSND